MSELKSRLTADMKTAMKNKDKNRLQTIRSINAAIKQIEIDERIEMTDEQVLSLLDKLSKQRKDSLKQYEDANREDLAAIEREELAVIQDYLPKQLDEHEIQAHIDTAIEETGASGMKDMGKVMATLKPKLAGRADMSAVSAMLKKNLNQ